MVNKYNINLFLNLSPFPEFIDMFASSRIGDIFWEKGVKEPVMKKTKGKYPAPLRIIEVGNYSKHKRTR